MPIVTSGGLLVSTDGWPLRYPTWFSALDKRFIDDALSTAAASATLQATPEIAPRRALTGPLHGRLFASEGAAVDGVLQVFAVVVRVVSAPREAPVEGERRQIAHQLFDELVVWIADLTPSVTDDFETRVRDALATCSWWTEAFQAASAEPVSGAATKTTDERVPLSISEFAERLGVSNDTIERRIKAGKLSTVQVGKRQKIPQSELDRLRNDPD